MLYYICYKKYLIPFDEIYRKPLHNIECAISSKLEIFHVNKLTLFYGEYRAGWTSAFKKYEIFKKRNWLSYALSPSLLKLTILYDASVEENHSVYMWNIFDIIDSFELTTAPTNKQHTWGCKLLDILLSAIGVQYHETLDVNHVISSIKQQQKFHREFAIFLQLLSTVVKIQRMKGTASDSWYGQLFRFSISCYSFYNPTPSFLPFSSIFFVFYVLRVFVTLSRLLVEAIL